MYKIGVSFSACAIVWAIWFFTAKSKNNHKQMLLATQLCCFAFVTYVWGALCGAVCFGAYALITYVKKLSPPTEEQKTQPQEQPQQIEIPLPQEKTEVEKKEEKKQWGMVVLGTLLIVSLPLLIAYFLNKNGF